MTSAHTPWSSELPQAPDRTDESKKESGPKEASGHDKRLDDGSDVVCWLEREAMSSVIVWRCLCLCHQEERSPDPVVETREKPFC